MYNYANGVLSQRRPRGLFIFFRVCVFILCPVWPGRYYDVTQRLWHWCRLSPVVAVAVATALYIYIYIFDMIYAFSASDGRVGRLDVAKRCFAVTGCRPITTE